MDVDKAMKDPERTNEVTGYYANHCVALAKELGISFIHLWSKMQGIDGWQKKYLSDGLHLTPEGNAFVHKEVVQVFIQEGLSAPDMSYDFPHHSQVDSENPKKAFTIQCGGPQRKVRNTCTPWIMAEDNILCSAYINVGMNPKLGNPHKCLTYWMRFTQYYNRLRPLTSIERSLDQVRGRWRRVAGLCKRFSRCYNDALSKQASGTNEDDVLRVAHQMYIAKNKNHVFAYEHFWRDLRTKPQWIAEVADEPHAKQAIVKRTKINVVGGYSSSSNPSTPASEGDPQSDLLEDAPPNSDFACESRHPVGVKQEKRRGKKKVQEDNQSFKEWKKSIENDKIEALKAIKESNDKTAEAERLKAKAKWKRVAIVEQEARNEAEKLRIQQWTSDNQVMYADTSNYSPVQLAFHEAQVKDICPRWGLNNKL